MSDNLKILLVEPDIIWEFVEENLLRYDEIVTNSISIIKEGVDILIFPELFAVGFTMNRALAEEMRGQSLLWMKKIAIETGSAIVASIPIIENERIYNRALFVTEEGCIAHYDKRHLFRMGDEHQAYTPGDKRCIVSYKSWNIMLNICYDLRFPVWSRNVSNEYDLIINIANWPSSRIEAATYLARARAIENSAYYLFANRIGSDPMTDYNGNSAIYDYKGVGIGEKRNRENYNTIYAQLSLDELQKYREKFPVSLDADPFEIIY